MNFRSSVQIQLPRTVCVDNTREQPRQQKREIRQEPGKSRNQEDGYSTGSLSEEHEDVFAACWEGTEINVLQRGTRMNYYTYTDHGNSIKFLML